ncbi:MAG: branched-chain amino acid ABC transporter permease [Hyphomicrobiaceae bacterium]
MFFVSLLIEGSLAGLLYALVATAFVVVYKASRVINFALGEWVMVAAILVAMGNNVLGLGLAGALAFGCIGMAVLAWVFNTIALNRLVGQPLIAVLMVTLGLGVLLRGLGQLLFSDVPRDIPLPLPTEPFVLAGLYVPGDKLAAAALAAVATALMAWFMQRSRSGVALRAIADDQKVAMALGIDVNRYVTLAWCLSGALCVMAGSLWTFIIGSGFGMGLVGLKIFPIVIIGGLDSIGGAIIAAVMIGLIESLATGYLEPILGSGCGLLAAYIALIVMLTVRPYGLFGERRVDRV